MALERLGSYELLFLLARGGMGSVHLARHVGAAGFERLVVVKRIHPHLAGEPEFRAMLVDEARLSALIRHANVVPALDVVDDGGSLGLVLEYVESVSLSHLLRAASTRGRLAPAIVCRIVADALAGLHAAHEAKDLGGRSLGIVHRDVSPQNILVGADGVSRLIDFGIAKAAERVSTTRSGVLKGKLRYMSPEHARHKDIDRRSDVFAAGAVLYEAWCGRPAFRGDTEASILLELLAGEISQPTQPDGEPLDSFLADVLARALATRPEERFASAAEFQKALTRAVPPASQTDVAEAVSEHAGRMLESQREGLAKALEGASELVPFMPIHVETTEHAAPPTSLPVPARRRVGLVVGGVSVVALALAVVVVRQVTGDEKLRADPPLPTPVVDSSVAADTSPAPVASPAVERATAAQDAGHGQADSGAPVPVRRRAPPPTPPSRPILHGNPYP